MTKTTISAWVWTGNAMGKTLDGYELKWAAVI